MKIGGEIMKKKTIAVTCVVFVMASLLSLGFIGCNLVRNATLRLDKIPVIGGFFLEVDKPAGFDATVCKDVITWDEVRNPPPEYDAENHCWFYLNPYTLWLLENYMRDNNLGIVPGDYPDFHLSADFDECLDTFEFVKLDE